MKIGGPSIITKSATAHELTSYSVPLGSMLTSSSVQSRRLPVTESVALPAPYAEPAHAVW
jgi:hypothetical protein